MWGAGPGVARHKASDHPNTEHFVSRLVGEPERLLDELWQQTTQALGYPRLALADLAVPPAPQSLEQLNPGEQSRHR